MAEKIELQNRLREIPYNYTSFADKDIVTRLLGKEAWQLLNELRVSGKPGRSARMLYEVLGDVWVIQRNPYLQEDMLFNKKRRDLLIEALYHRINSIREQLPTLDEVSAGKIAALMETALVMIEKFKGSFERSWDLRRLVLKKLKKHTRTDNIRFDGFSRASHVTDATDWRVEYPFVVIYPDSEDEVPGIVKALIDLDFVIIPRGGGTGYTGGAGRCIVYFIDNGDIQAVAVLLGCPTSNDRVKDGVKLLQYITDEFETYTLIERGTLVDYFAVEKGRRLSVNAIVDSDVRVTLKKSERTEIRTSYTRSTEAELSEEGFPLLQAPVSYSDVLGVLWIKCGTTCTLSVDVTAEGSVLRKTYTDHLGDLINTLPYVFG